jgi:hypothetical protein
LDAQKWRGVGIANNDDRIENPGFAVKHDF